MLLQTMSRMMESMSPSSVVGLNATRPSRSTGRTKAVYDQMRAEFFIAGPFVVHAEVPSLLAASWALVRETLFAGDADRGDKEAIAWAVSQSNQCPFCIDAHGAARAAAETEDPVIERWARASNSARAAATVPFPKGLLRHRSECLGTVVAFHYLNRMVSVFLDDKMMPLPSAFDGATRSMAKFMMGGMIDKAENLEGGKSLQFLSDGDPSLAWRPSWVEESSPIAEALAGWSSTVEGEAAKRFEPTVLNHLANRFDRWDGGDLDLAKTGGGPADVDVDGHEHTDADVELSDLPPELFELAVRVVEAPFHVVSEDVEAAIASSSSADTLTLVAWAAQRAARRCSSWAAAGTRFDHPR